MEDQANGAETKLPEQPILPEPAGPTSPVNQMSHPVMGPREKRKPKGRTIVPKPVLKERTIGNI